MTIKAKLKKLIPQKAEPKRILITFSLNKLGKPVTDIKMDKDILANHAAKTLEQIAGSIANGLVNKVNEVGLNEPGKKQEDFIMQQTIGDIL